MLTFMAIPLPVIANTYRVALMWNTGASGQTAVNVIHMQANTSGTHAADCTQAFINAWTYAGAGILTDTASAAVMFQVNATPLDGVSSTYSELTGSGSAFQGQASGNWVPAVAVLTKLTTGLRGRNHRGRVYLPFTAESKISNGQIPSTDAVGMTAGWVSLQSKLASYSPEWQIGVAAYDRKHSGAGAQYNGATGFLTEQTLATQRRRQGRLRGA